LRREARAARLNHHVPPNLRAVSHGARVNTGNPADRSGKPMHHKRASGRRPNGDGRLSTIVASQDVVYRHGQDEQREANERIRRKYDPHVDDNGELTAIRTAVVIA